MSHTGPDEGICSPIIIDGEIVAVDENGRVSFNLLQHHSVSIGSRSQAWAIRGNCSRAFYVFDVLVYRGKGLLTLPLERRRAILEELLKADKSRAVPIGLSEHIEASPSDLVRVVKEFGFEGIIAKRRDSCYESGKRSGAWVKYKVNKSQEFVIGGYTRGDPLDAVIVGYYEGDNLMFAAKVRNGFVPHLRRLVATRLKRLETDTCPFANLPERKRTQWALTKEQMKNCVWLKPKVVAQIEFTEWTPDKHLRHPVFVGLREDKDPRDIRREE